MNFRCYAFGAYLPRVTIVRFVCHKGYVMGSRLNNVKSRVGVRDSKPLFRRPSRPGN